jgi:hypothetical protein
MAGKKVLQQGSALRFEDSTSDIDAMVEPGIAYYVEERADRASLRIEGTEDEPGDAGQDKSAGAHGAGLEGDNKSETSQSP